MMIPYYTAKVIKKPIIWQLASILHQQDVLSDLQYFQLYGRHVLTHTWTPTNGIGELDICVQKSALKILSANECYKLTKQLFANITMLHERNPVVVH